MTPEQTSELSALMAAATDPKSSGRKTDLYDRYLAEPYGDEVPNRSRFVDASCSDAVDAIHADIMDVFTSTENLAEFTPVGIEDEQGARQETQAVNHVFWQKNNGFDILYSWTKEAMIQQNAYVWRGWVEKERVEIEEYEDLTPEEFLAILVDLAESDYEFLEKEGFEVDEDDAIQMTAETVNVKIRCVSVDKEYVIETFPQEDCVFTPRWGRLSFDGIPLVARRHRDKSREDWLAFGFSEGSLDRLTQGNTDEEEQSARFNTRDTDETDSTDNIELYECYARLDVNDDGINELVRVWCDESGGTVMEWDGGKEAIDEVSDIPIHALTPFVMPHRHTGRSVVENVDDIARVKTVLMRHTLDGIYASLYARPHYNENDAGEHLSNDLVSPEHGAAVRTGGADVQYPMAAVAQSIPSVTLPLYEKFSDMGEARVGATRYNQGLDADSLNKTARGIGMIMNASQKKAKLIARTFAETGIRDLFLGIHRDLRAGPMKELMIKISGQYAPVNPRLWKHRTDMVVNVGMGRGDREERRAALMQTGQVQRELVAAGSRMVSEENLFNTFDGFLQTFGIENGGRYFQDPRTLPPPQPQPERPDPIMISAQAQAQKAQADAQRDAAKLQADERNRQRQHEVDMQKLRIKELELMARIQGQNEKIDLDKNKAVMDDDFKRDKLEVDALTGLHREQTRRVQSEPPVSYGEVTK